MKMKKNLMMMLAACLALSVPLSGCGSTVKDTSSSVSSEVSGEAETSGKSSQELLDEENAIMAKNNDLWEKVFASMSKNVTEDMLGSNYGDVLMAAVEGIKDQLTNEEYQTLKGHAQKIHDLEDGAKDQFTDAEYKTLKSDAEQIRKIEEEIAALPTDSSEEQTSDASGTAFPQFEGKDLDGNKVDSSVFAENAVTVVNFWFNECKPCVEELSEMNALNDRIKEQGGEVLGVNVGALDGDEQNIATAKQILETKGAKYRNIYFDSDSDAGKFALGVTAFPTTYVIDRNGNIVGEALMGGIDNDENLSTLQNTIDEVLAKDAQK